MKLLEGLFSGNGRAVGEHKTRSKGESGSKSLHHHFKFSPGLDLLSLGSLGALHHLSARNAAEHGRGTELSAARVVVKEDAARGVARSVQTLDAFAVQVLHLSLGVDQGTAEGRGHAALEGNGVERGLGNRMGLLVGAGRVHFAELAGRVEFSDSAASIESNLQEELLGYTNYKSKFYGFWR